MKYLSALLTQASGSIGGATASTNRGGNYFRARVAPIQPRTTAQQEVRALLATFSAQWRSLTQGQIAGWNSLASGVTLHDSLGNAYKPTGAQLFVSCNTNLSNAGQANVVVPPSTAPTIPYPGAPILTRTTTGTPTLSLSFPTPLAADQYYAIISATRQLSPGISYIGRSEYRIIATAGGDSIDTILLESPYAARFGTPTTNSVISTSTVIIETASGFASQPYTAEVR